MSERRSSHHHHHHHHRPRQTFDEKYRVIENELKRKNDTIDSLRNDTIDISHQNDLSHSSCTPVDSSFIRNVSLRSNASSNWNSLTKDREIAKLKALVFQKDNEVIALASTHKNALLQMEDRMERERKVWNEHKELLLAGERAKFEEEKTRLLKDLQHQLNIERERCQRFEQKLYDAQMQSSEAKLMLKESGRERINAVYGTKEQCRKEFQDEINRLRNQFQLERDAEFTRIQERVRELEDTLDQVSTENADVAARQHELFVNLEASEKTCVRSITDSIKKLLMAIDSPSHVYATIPHISSFTYDRDSIVERLPTRSVLKLLQDTVDEIRNYVLEQKVQIETKTKFLKKSKVLTDRTTDYSNRTYDDSQPQQPPLLRSSLSKHRKENDRLSQTCENRSNNSSYNPFQLSSQQNDTIDNLVQKLEDHIATELDRLTKQRITLNNSNHNDERMTLNSSNHHDERPTSYYVESPKKVKFESIPSNNVDEVNQDSLIRHLQSRISDLRDDNMRLRDTQQPKSTLPSYHENDNQHSFSSMRSRNYPKT
ncbi:unnamed protein product [Rotaria socialis]|uniref:Uncharacterized protein n=1 Tax=Rotaria socialis TaxID=392032 RepID=A0A820MJV0_9BILA|nr:unnamed protein product [Rotaria socialis]CAF3578374.1 unnamed protein product [Rotaria socialis]CAF3708084.1 unnamed protein product [Rotaria socialis]CAF3760476.1 unnamed protein product [Rotaria socialis]CAF3774225.1 unnamed protein product [Rotaria socialis]